MKYTSENELNIILQMLCNLKRVLSDVTGINGGTFSCSLVLLKFESEFSDLNVTHTESDSVQYDLPHCGLYQ